MAGELTLFKDGNQVPAYLKNREADAITKSLAGGGAQSKRISIRGGVWRLLSGGKEIAVNEDRAMNFVIVNAAPKTGRVFYEGTFDPDADKASAPVCWSADGDKPDSKVEEPQSSTCATCPQNIKGSGQGDTKACRYSQRLAVVLENDLSGDVFQLTLAATSIFGDGENGKLPLKAYAKFLDGFNVPITSVVTEARFDTKSATPKLTFKAVRPLTEEEYEQSIQAGQTAAAKQAIMLTVAQQDGVKKLENKQAPAPKAEKPAVKEEAEEAAPKKRDSKAPPPEPKKDAKALLAEWDD